MKTVHFIQLCLVLLFVNHTSSQPDLSCAWSSSFGNINWEQGWYGNTSKTITGKLYKSGSTYYYSGFWGRKTSSGGGKVYFKFTDDLNFTGYYTKGDSEKQYTWTGGSLCPSEELGRPDLTCAWSSSFGNINWQEGWYGNTSKLITGQLYKSGNTYYYKGSWARKTSSGGGKIYFKFISKTEFIGYYTKGDSEKQYTWTGSSLCPSEELGRPDLTCAWSSSFGNINWQEGWYGNTNKLMIGQLYKSGNTYYYKGSWARKTSSGGGKIYFKFINKTEFIGYYTKGDSEKQYTWKGSSLCE